MDIKTAAVIELPFMHRKRFCVFSLHPDGEDLDLQTTERTTNESILGKVFYGIGVGRTGEIPPVPNL